MVTQGYKRLAEINSEMEHFVNMRVDKHISRARIDATIEDLTMEYNSLSEKLKPSSI